MGKREKKISHSLVPSLFSLGFSCCSKKTENAVGLRDLLDIEDILKIHLFEIKKKKSHSRNLSSFEVICYTRLLELGFQQ